jgi:hypothetical protein
VQRVVVLEAERPDARQRDEHEEHDDRVAGGAVREEGG